MIAMHENMHNDLAILIGDIIHNLRCSMDHIYWDCTNQFAKSEGEKNKIQFPISNTEDNFKNSVLKGLPKRVSPEFSLALEGFRPYRNGGNLKLCAIHDLDVLDKHKLLIPVGDYTNLDAAQLKKLVPDFPLSSGTFGFGCNNRDMVWNIKPMTWTQRRKAKIPPSNIKEQVIDVPVKVVLRSEAGDFNESVDDFLAGLIVEAKVVVKDLSALKL